MSTQEKIKQLRDRKIELERIEAEWAKDCIINEFNLNEASINTPKLHSKYLHFYNVAKAALHETEQKYTQLLKFRWLWYEGKMSQEEIDKLNWSYDDPYNGLNLRSKQNREMFWNADKVLQAGQSDIEYYKRCCDTLKEIIDSIKFRHITIKNIIEYTRMQSGL